jgi:hypothetical protein
LGGVVRALCFTLCGRLSPASRSHLLSADRWEIRHDEGRGGDEVVGRIEMVEPFGPLTLVVDGRAVTWEELGKALSPYEGCQFVLRITDRFGDPRH